MMELVKQSFDKLSKQEKRTEQCFKLQESVLVQTIQRTIQQLIPTTSATARKKQHAIPRMLHQLREEPDLDEEMEVVEMRNSAQNKEAKNNLNYGERAEATPSPGNHE